MHLSASPVSSWLNHPIASYQPNVFVSVQNLHSSTLSNRLAGGRRALTSLEAFSSRLAPAFSETIREKTIQNIENHRRSKRIRGLISASSLQAMDTPAISQNADVGLPIFLGFDFGTSGARVMAIDERGYLCADAKQPYPDNAATDWAATWKIALFSLLEDLPLSIRARVSAISIDGTSSTTMIIDRRTKNPTAPPVLYNEARPEALPAVKEIAPANHTVTSGTSTLCKLVAWWDSQANSKSPAKSAQMVHQADWLLSLLHEETPVTDYNNALKVGYDPGVGAYPDWLAEQPYAEMLPAVVAPGEVIGHISPSLAKTYGLPPTCSIVAGTTDSIAAFLAAGVSQIGQAVTSLGSTMAVKMLSSFRVDDAKYGVYSHKLNDKWLVGGASNTGGAALKNIFSVSELKELSEKIDFSVPSPLDYYPLPSVGERFPLADPRMEPRLDPRPASDVEYLHGLLESMARIEGRAYSLLKELGASPLTEVYTAGGGSSNATWTAIRGRVLGVPVRASLQTEAAYGAALLALQSASVNQKP